MLIWVCGLASLQAGRELASSDSLRLRSTAQATVPLFNAWTIGWNVDRLAHGFAGYWDAPVFFPARSAFAFSEPQPATLVLAPVVWLSGSPVAALNVWVWLSLVLNGMFAWRLLRQLQMPDAASAVGASAMTMLPLSIAHADVAQLVPVWPALWLWSALLRFRETTAASAAVSAGAAAGMSAAVCVHQTLLLGVVMLFCGWLLWPRG